MHNYSILNKLYYKISCTLHEYTFIFILIVIKKEINTNHMLVIRKRNNEKTQKLIAAPFVST